jgi:sugar phosphate isomerase/epimerase
MKIGIVTDEISLNIDEAFNYCKEWDINLVELRCLESGRVPNINEEELGKLLKLKKNFGIEVTAISPGIFKSPLIEMNKIHDELNNTLPLSFSLAEKLGTSMIIVFGFQRLGDEKESDFDNIVNLFGEAASNAEKFGFKISVENEPGFWCDSGENTAKIIQKVNMKNFGANWDPGNAVGNTEIPYPDGYNFIKNYISNVHVKDTKVSSLIECFVIGEGVIDWENQIKALIEDRPVSHVTIETHCQPLIEKSKKNIDILRALIKKYQK